MPHVWMLTRTSETHSTIVHEPLGLHAWAQWPKVRVFLLVLTVSGERQARSGLHSVLEVH